MYDTDELPPTSGDEAKTNARKFFDFIENIDRSLYGHKLKILIWSSMLVLFIAPLADHYYNSWDHRATLTATVLFVCLLFFLALAFVSSLRDATTGRITVTRVKYRVKTNALIILDFIKSLKDKTADGILLNLSILLFISCLLARALHNVSVVVRRLIRKPLHIHIRAIRAWEHWERQTISYSIYFLVFGAAIFLFLYWQNNKTFKMLLTEIRFILFSKHSGGSGKAKVFTNSSAMLVLNRQNKAHMREAEAMSHSHLFNKFIKAIHSWQPHNVHYEYQYQDQLLRHLSAAMPHERIQAEYPIGSKKAGNNGRADIVINESILIEMKKDTRTDTIDRAAGQITRYARVWKNKGPVILFLCDCDYEKASLVLAPVMADMAKLSHPALTIVSEPAQKHHLEYA